MVAAREEDGGIIERLDRWAGIGPYAIRVDTDDVVGYEAGEVAQFAHSILVDMARQDGENVVAERYDGSTDLGHDFPVALKRDVTRHGRVYIGNASDRYVRELVDRFGDSEMFDRVDIEPNGGPFGPIGGGY